MSNDEVREALRAIWPTVHWIRLINFEKWCVFCKHNRVDSSAPDSEIMHSNDCPVIRFWEFVDPEAVTAD